MTCKLWLNLRVEKFSLGEVLIRFEISRCFKLNLATMVHHTLLTSVLWNSCSKCNRSQMFFKIDFLNNFVIFTGKYLCWSLFLIKLTPKTPKRLQHKCFFVNIAKFLRTPFLRNTSGSCFYCFKKFVHSPENISGGYLIHLSF